MKNLKTIKISYNCDKKIDRYREQIIQLRKLRNFPICSLMPYNETKIPGQLTSISMGTVHAFITKTLHYSKALLTSSQFQDRDPLVLFSAFSISPLFSADNL